MRCTAFVGVVGYCLLNSSSAVWAQDFERKSAQAEKLYQQALVLWQEHSKTPGKIPRQACEKFEESAAVLPRAKTRTAIAECQLDAKDTLGAFESISRARELFQLDPGSPALAAQIDSVRDRIPIPSVAFETTTPPRGLSIFLDAVEREPGAEIKVRLGSHTVRAHADGFERFEQEVIVEKPQRYSVPIVLRRVSPPFSRPQQREKPSVPPPVAAPSEIDETSDGSAQLLPDDPDRARGTQLMWGRALVAAGGVGVLVSGVLGLMTLNTVSKGGDCVRTPGCSDREAAQRTQNYGLVSLGVGSAALGAGVLLLLNAPPEPTVAGSQGALILGWEGSRLYGGFTW